MLKYLQNFLSFIFKLGDIQVLEYVVLFFEIL